MADIKLDDSGDIEIGTDGDLILVTGLDAIRQDLETRLKFFRGEWDLDTRLGIPYFDEILIKAPDLNVVRSLFRDAILSTAGVLRLTRLDLDYEGTTRTLSIRFDCQTTEGPLTYEDELIVPLPQ